MIRVSRSCVRRPHDAGSLAQVGAVVRVSDGRSRDAIQVHEVIVRAATLRRYVISPVLLAAK